MRAARFVACFAVALAGSTARQDDPVAALKALPPEKAETEGKRILLESLARDFSEGLKALEEGRLAAFETRLLRAAHLSRPYSDEHARRLGRFVLAVRHDVRERGAALARAVAADVAQRKVDAAAKRIDDALHGPLGKEFREPIARLKEWLKTPPEPQAVEAEVTFWRGARPASIRPSCSACSEAGETDCGACLTGFIAQSCRTCSGKGSGPCVLCNGTGALPHGGCAGRFDIIIEKPIRVQKIIRRRKVAVVFHPQVLTWVLGPCDGKGHVSLRTESRPDDPNVPAQPPQHLNKDCNELHQELKTFVFTGRAKVEQVRSSDPTKRSPLPPAAARRLFTDYEKCNAGRVPCDRCRGKKTGTCEPCGGKGSRPGPCSDCAGLAVRPCETCGQSGDSEWLAKRLPSERVPGLREALGEHAEKLAAWHDRRVRQLARLEQVKLRFEEARRGIEPTARIEADYVNLPCERCKGKGGSCEDCWGSGRIEYYDGTPEYAKYAAFKKLSDQMEEMAKASQTPAPGLSLDALIGPEPAARKPPPPRETPPPPPPPDPPPAASRGVGSGIGGEISDLPADIQEMIAKADALHEEGKGHLERAKNNADTDVWVEESKKAVEKLREAQTLYATAQETLDERGIDTPKALLEKFRINMQALVIARKQAP